MKSYTDLEQSKKLAEFLPLESADMHYKVNRHNNESKIFMISYSELGYYKDNDYQYSVCAWSLAALISIIPQELFDGEYIINITEGLNCKWIISYEARYDISSYVDVSGDSLIDCCVGMIIKLHERNLL